MSRAVTETRTRPALPGGLSPYDEAVPGPRPHPRLAARFARLRALRGADPGLLGRVRDVVLVVSSSRGGSTLLAELLRRSPELLSLPGEVNPYVAVAQLSRTGRGEVLAAEVAAEIGSPTTHLDPDDLVRSCLWRLTAQWPSVDLPEGVVARAVRAALDTCGTGRPVPSARFTRAVLAHLATSGWPLDAGRYDQLSGAGAGPRTDGPPDPELVVEMPPFRLLTPWRRASAEEVGERTLVVATPRNSYRVGHLAALFPGARVRLLHLVRNPAASANGLVDGWRHHGFFSTPMPVPLAVDGYTTRARPWSRRWWKFDVPPAWPGLVHAPLPRVCAEQWASAHEAVLGHLPVLPVHRVRFEDLTGPPAVRAETACALAAWLGLSDPQGLVRAVGAGLSPQMATARPRSGRWRERGDDLGVVLGDERVLGLAERLGYDRSSATWS